MYVHFGSSWDSGTHATNNDYCWKCGAYQHGATWTWGNTNFIEHHVEPEVSTLSLEIRAYRKRNLEKDRATWKAEQQKERKPPRLLVSRNSLSHPPRCRLKRWPSLKERRHAWAV